MVRKNTKATKTAGNTSSKSAAKTATKNKPVAETPPVSAPEIQMISLSALALSPKNVRRVQTSETDDAELKASIRQNGIKQNLIAYKADDGSYLVDAGGRRLKALKELAADGSIADTYLVPCLIEDEAEAIITSTTENLQRAAMHPADQFDAFDQMITEGRSEDDIALKFGVSIDLVRRRLKLARVAPEIVEQFREGELTLECVMAFTLTDNHDRQMTVWNAIKDGWNVQPYTIKRHLTETAYAANSRIARFVGVETYEAAGGVVMRDLFDERDTAHLENPELLERLAIEKLQEVAKTLEKDWKWAELYLELDYDAFRSFGRVYPLEIEPDPDLAKEEDLLNAREEELAMLNDGGDWSDEETEEYHAIAPRLAEIEDLQDARRPYSDEDRKIAGCVVTIGHRGELQIEKGLVRPDDIPQQSSNTSEDGAAVSGPQVTPPTSSTPVPVSDPAAALRKADGISASLADDLRATRHQILQAHLAADYDVAYDTMLYTLCQQALVSGYRYNDPLECSLRAFHVQNREQLLSETIAQKMLDALKSDLVIDWMELEAPEDFRAMSALPSEDKQALFAWATAYALKPQLATDNRPDAVIEELGTRLDVDVAACWRPAASTYWSRVNKAHAVDIARTLLGEDYAEDRNRERKSDLATAMERSFAENAVEADGLDPKIAVKTTRWLPKGMAFNEANLVDADHDDDDGQDTAEQPESGHDHNAGCHDNEVENLPAFMTEDAA